MYKGLCMNCCSSVFWYLITFYTYNLSLYVNVSSSFSRVGVVFVVSFLCVIILCKILGMFLFLFVLMILMYSVICFVFVVDWFNVSCGSFGAFVVSSSFRCFVDCFFVYCCMYVFLYGVELMYKCKFRLFLILMLFLCVCMMILLSFALSSRSVARAFCSKNFFNFCCVSIFVW